MTTRFGKSSWKEFDEKELKIIKEEREKAKLTPVKIVPNKQFSKVCRACTKPNNINQNFCTGCGFELVEEDVQQLPDNVFLDIVKGNETGTNVVYRDEDYLAFDDKFGVSDNHLDVIPTQVIEDISVLTKEHIPMIKKLYEIGFQEFLKRGLDTKIYGDNQKETLHDLVTAGYNFPVSVKHLHLHMVLPPFKHKKVFQYPRWHSHTKILNDLEKYGRVILYSEKPNDEEGKKEYERAISNHDLLISRNQN